MVAFLSRTGLPVVPGLRWISLTLALGSLGVAIVGVALGISTVFDGSDSSWDSVAVSAGVPMFLMSHHFARRSRVRASATWLSCGLYVLSLASTLVRGELTPGWFLQPLLALLVTSALGSVTGLTLTLFSAVVVVVSPWLHGFGAIGTSSAAVILFAGLIGVVLHRVLRAAVAGADELRQQEKLLSHALRIETVGDLASMVVHRLRNHFQVILGHVTMGSRSEVDERSRHLEMIGRTLDDASPLLDQLLGLAHPEEGEPRPCDLNELAGDFVTNAGRVLPSTVDLDQRLAAGRLPVLLDPRGLEHALLNLVINARDAMGGRGAMVISTGSQGDRAWISVGDSGPGIASEHLERIFDPYFTTKPVGQGTGLGLTAVSRFAASSRGHVRVDNGEAGGATFTLSFPTAAPGAVRGAERNRGLEGRATG